MSPILYSAQVKKSVTNANIKNNAIATASNLSYNGDICYDSATNSSVSGLSCAMGPHQRMASANVLVTTPGSFQIKKEVPVKVVPVNSQFIYDMYARNNGSNVIGSQEYIDILPYNGDA
jgi:hypothetical protein